MISTKESNICTCEVVHSKDILVTRCINGKPKHRSCGGTIESYTEKRVIEDDRPRIENR